MTSPFEPPIRHALANAELANELAKVQATGGALAAMGFLQEQNRVRANDEIAFIGWVRDMEAEGSAEAFAAIDRARHANLGLSIDTESLSAEVKSTLAGDLAALGDWQARAERVEAERLEQEDAERVVREKAEFEAAEAERLEREEQERLQAEREEAELLRKTAEREAEAERLYREAAELADREAREAAEYEELLEQERLAELEAQRLLTALMAEPAPQRAADFATGSFDIVETAQNEIAPAVDDKSFDEIVQSDAIAFASEKNATASMMNGAISELLVWSGIGVGVVPILLGALVAATGIPVALAIGSVVFGIALSIVLIVFTARARARSVLVSGAGSLAKLVFGVALVGSMAFILFNDTVAGLPSLNQAAASGVSLSWLFILGTSLLVVATLFAAAGRRVLRWLQTVTGTVGIIVTVIFAISTLSATDFSMLDFSADASGPQWAIAVALSGLIGAGFGGFWASAAADITLDESGTRPAGRMVLFVAVPAGLLTLIGAIASTLAVAASKTVDQGLVQSLLSGVPYWFATVLLLGGAIQLLTWSATWLYPLGLTVRSFSKRIGRVVSQVIVLVLAVALLYVLSSVDAAALRAVALIALVILMAVIGVVVVDSTRSRVSIALTLGMAIVIGLGTISTSLDNSFVTNFIGAQIPAIDFKDAQVGLLLSLVVSALISLAIRMNGKRVDAQIISSQSSGLA
ncbi:MAG: hypothetical protein ACKOWJ_04540 [Micrococcales bacterium]